MTAAVGVAAHHGVPPPVAAADEVGTDRQLRHHEGRHRGIVLPGDPVGRDHEAVLATAGVGAEELRVAHPVHGRARVP